MQIFNYPSNNLQILLLPSLNGAGIFVKNQFIATSLPLGSELRSTHHETHPSLGCITLSKTETLHLFHSGRANPPVSYF